MAALSREELLRLARAGAGARVRELQAELDSIYHTFPELRTGDGKRAKTSGASKVIARASASVKRAWSAAEKKAVSDRMKKYWAARKAASTKSKSAKAAAK